MDEVLLPLFPLELVLFPDEVLPLHIFEDRYKTMIVECLSKGTKAGPEAEFGVVCVHSEKLNSVGCTARITEVVRKYEDGRLDILTCGQRRFEILLTNSDRPYLRGAVEFFDDDDPSPGPAAETARAWTLFGEVIKRLDLTEEQAGLGRKVRHRSFQIAAALPLGLELKQEVLTLRNERERLHKLSELMERIIPALEMRQQARIKASGNGHVTRPGSSSSK